MEQSSDDDDDAIANVKSYFVTVDFVTLGQTAQRRYRAVGLETCFVCGRVSFSRVIFFDYFDCLPDRHARVLCTRKFKKRMVRVTRTIKK